MIIEQETRTTIKADEGKILVRKSDGQIIGDTIHLGYDYYDAGVALSNPRLMKPEDYEEIDIPEDYETKPLINHVQRLKRTQELIKQATQEMNTLNLTPVEALEVLDWFPQWGVDEGFKAGDTITKGQKFKYDGKLWAVLQDHTILEHYYPSINTASLYVEVTPEYNENGEELGTLDNPIPYDGNMILENGKYYIQEGTIYKCNRDTGIAVYHALRDLVGLYVELV